jgi:two-component system sensor histidine kinase RpfC
MKPTAQTEPPGERPPLRHRVFERILPNWRLIVDGEHEIACNRLIISLVVLLYDGVNSGFGSLYYVIAPLLYLAAGILIFVHIRVRPLAGRWRKYLSLLTDIVLLSFALSTDAKYNAIIFVSYLWITFGYGFRYGLKYLYLASIASIIGFSVVVAVTPFWRGQIFLSLGLLIGLLVLPLYAGGLIRKLSRAKQEAEAASQAKSLFLASVSHELRTPLNAIIGMGDLLRHTTLDSEQSDMTRTIGSAARALISMIDGVLDLSRIETGRMPTETVTFDLLELLREIRDLVAAQAREKNLHLGLHMSARTPRMLCGDRRHLHEILLNLAGNAVKFTDSGTVLLAADGVATGGMTALRLEVSDSGIGIAPEAQEMIFQSFTQANASIVQRYGGTGLGLAICKRLAGLLDAEIGVTSAPGAGSVFHLTLVLPHETMAPAVALADLPPTLLLAPLVVAEPPALAALVARGLALQRVDSAADAVAAVRAAIVDAKPMPTILAVETLAPSLLTAIDAAGFSSDPTLVLPLVLLSAEEPQGMLPLGWRRVFVSCLDTAPTPESVLAALSIAHSPPTAPQEVPPLPADRRSLHILVADDNRTNQKVVAKILERAGHRSTMVENGEQALEILEEESFDLVLMDINMPVMGGIEATKLYRFMSLGDKHLPIVALTADATQEAARRCREAGMDACVTKPIEPAALIGLIERLVPASSEGAAPTSVPIENPSGARVRARSNSAPRIGRATGGGSAEGAEPVTEIAIHPRFRRADAGSVDMAVLDDLMALGGEAFVRDLIQQFLSDAKMLIEDLSRAALAGDVETFRGQAHALRSAAANVGARGLFDLCLSWRLIRRQDVAEQGSEHIRRLTGEFDRVRGALLGFRPGEVEIRHGGA